MKTILTTFLQIVLLLLFVPGKMNGQNPPCPILNIDYTEIGPCDRFNPTEFLSVTFTITLHPRCK